MVYGGFKFMDFMSIFLYLLNFKKLLKIYEIYFLFMVYKSKFKILSILRNNWFLYKWFYCSFCVKF